MSKAGNLQPSSIAEVKRKTKAKNPLYGVPWSDEEHQLFLSGIKLYGRGEWTMIAKNVIRSRTPSQVASHAQKYYKRKESRIDYEAISKKRLCMDSPEDDTRGAPGLDLISSLVAEEADVSHKVMRCDISLEEEVTKYEKHSASGEERLSEEGLQGPPANLSSTHYGNQFCPGETSPQGPLSLASNDLDTNLASFNPPSKPQIVRLLPFSLAIPHIVLGDDRHKDPSPVDSGLQSRQIAPWSPLHSLTLPAPPTTKLAPWHQILPRGNYPLE